MNKRGSCYPSAVVMKNFISWITVAISIIISFDYAIAANVSLKITAPANGAIVNGTVTIATAESSNVSWINVFVDNVWVASNSPTALRPYSVSWGLDYGAGRQTLRIRDRLQFAQQCDGKDRNHRHRAQPADDSDPVADADDNASARADSNPAQRHRDADPSTHTDPNAAAGQRHADSRCYRDLLPVVRRRACRHGRA